MGTISEDPTLCVHDFNGDGKPDLAAFTPYADAGLSGFQLNMNVGAGAFENPGFARYLEQYIVNLTMIDLNHDAKPDLVFGYHGFNY